MQTISDDLAALLTSKLQAAASGFRGRVEVDGPGWSIRPLASAVAVEPVAISSLAAPSIAPLDSNIILVAALQLVPNRTLVLPTGWTERIHIVNAIPWRLSLCDKNVSTAAPPYDDVFSITGGASLWQLEQFALKQSGAGGILHTGSASGTYSLHEFFPAAVDRTVTATLSGTPTAGNILICYQTEALYGPVAGDLGVGVATPAGWKLFQLGGSGGSLHIGGSRLFYRVSDGTETGITITANYSDMWTLDVIIAEYPAESLPVSTSNYQAKSIDIDQSLSMSAGQMAVELANEDLALGWAGSSVFPTNSRIRAYGWLGAVTNEVRTFTGVVDLVGDSRDPLNISIACRDMMAILIDQTHTAIGPQGADETGTVRTEANGVYLNREVDYIVSDILDRWGWPAADRAITPTSYTLAEFIIADGESGTSAIIGEGKLTGLVGYDAWADELGVFHFAPSVSASALTETSVPAYTFRTGVDIVSLSDEMQQYDLRTRVKVRGPMTTETLTDTWRELWRTSKIRYPVGFWYDPSDPGNIRVLDRGTKRVYTLRQADQVVLSSVYLGSVIPYPLGLSGDQADASVYWVLNCPWKYGGATTGNSVKKVRKSDNVVTATYSLPNGRWTDLKVSGTGLWLTNWDTDRFYKRSKVDGSAVADYGHTVDGVTQTNPSGLMVDGTTLHIFWSNSGTTARFLICDESAPGTVTKVIATAGTTLVGGEMNTTTHTECWGGSDTLGLVEKFSLVDVSSTTAEVFEEVADSALEDELGALAQTEPRVHDTHPEDVAHPWMIRRDTVTLDAIISLAQASETARRRLDKLAHRSRALDFGILGNPAVQKTDLVRVEDPKTGIGENFLINTYRSGMSNTYTGVIAGIPVVSPGDVVTDNGSAS